MAIKLVLTNFFDCVWHIGNKFRTYSKSDYIVCNSSLWVNSRSFYLVATFPVVMSTDNLDSWLLEYQLRRVAELASILDPPLPTTFEVLNEEVGIVYNELHGVFVKHTDKKTKNDKKTAKAKSKTKQKGGENRTKKN